MNAGIPKDKLESVPSTSTNILKLKRGRIDLWAYGENVAAWEIKAQGFDPNDYETVYVLNEKELYYAFHKETQNSVIRHLQSALDSLKVEGTYEEILDKYLK